MKEGKERECRDGWKGAENKDKQGRGKRKQGTVEMKEQR